MFPRTQEAADAFEQTILDIAHELACAPRSTPVCPDDAAGATSRWVPNFVGGWEKSLKFPSDDGEEVYDVVVGGGFDEDDGSTFVNVCVNGTDAGTTWFLAPGAMVIMEEHEWSGAEPLPEWVAATVRDVVNLVSSSRRRSELV